jgi:hypothetical protein
MRVKTNISLHITQKGTQPRVRLVLKDSSRRSFMLLVAVSLQLGSAIQSNLMAMAATDLHSQIAIELRPI